ncbi:MAG: HlyD family secretion protein [Myxococcaceae bacterium]
MRQRIVPLLLLLALGGGYAVYRQRAANAPLEWSGTVEARSLEVASRVGGRIQEVHVREGDDIQKGQVLLTLEPGELPAQRVQAEGQMLQAQAALERVVRTTVPNARRAEIDAARGRLQSAEAQLDKARLDRDRTQKLAAAGAATPVDDMNADIALRNMTAQVAVQSATLRQLLEGTPQDVKAAEGQVQIARGRLEQLDVLLSELSVRSPIDGRVESLDWRTGEILSPNTPAASLLEPNHLYVRIFVPETQLGFVSLGKGLTVHVDSFPERGFRGTVEFIARQGEFSPRNLQTADERANQVFATRVRLEEGHDVLRAGMSATLRVPR